MPGQNKWLQLTRPSMILGEKFKDQAGIQNGAVLAIPIYSGISSNGLIFAVEKDSPDDENPENVEIHWASDTPLIATNPPQGWGGAVPEGGFNNCVTYGIYIPGFQATTLPMLQFKASEDSYKYIKGMAKVRIRKRGYPDTVYMFGIQFVEDTKKGAYISEEAITISEGGGYDFLPPHRLNSKQNNAT